MDGPRGARIQDLPSVRALTDGVMRQDLVDQYPQLFDYRNLQNLRICCDGERCVSHVGMTEQAATLYGCPIRVACIGGVCTLPEYRGRGLASACFDDAIAKASLDGVHVMIVSGNRSLYRRRGCTPVGLDTAFTVFEDQRMADGSGETFGEPVGSESEQVSADTMQPEELSLVMECYRREPVRFVRPPAVYEQALKCGWVMDGPSDLFVVREQGSFRGYMIVPRASGDDRARIAEFAGDRRSLLAAIPLILRQRSLRSILVHVQRHDILLQSLFEQRGLKGATVASPGTVTLIDFPGLMECLRPWFVERVGTRVVAQLQWDQAGEKVWIRLGADEIVAGRAETARMLFGSAEEEWSPLLLPESALCDMLKAALPLPSLWYGINYV